MRDLKKSDELDKEAVATRKRIAEKMSAADSSQAG
jgi:hypothetical protein